MIGPRREFANRLLPFADGKETGYAFGSNPPYEFRLLYDIEAEVRGSPPELRRALRQQRSKPIVEALKPWFEDNLARMSKGSKRWRSKQSIALRTRLWIASSAGRRLAPSRWLAMTVGHTNVIRTSKSLSQYNISTGNDRLAKSQRHPRTGPYMSLGA